MNQVIKVTMGTALSIALMAIAYVVATKYVMTEISDMSQQMIQHNQQRIEQQQAKLAQEQRRKQEIEKLHAAEAARKQAQARQKEAAWFKWYKEPDGCQTFKSNEHMVECINHKMRAKREFEALWAQGKIDAATL